MAIKLSNRGFSDVRLRIVPDAGTTLAIDHTTNPCVTMSSDNKELFACLGPFEISCVGAVSDSGPINLNGRFNIRLDGQIAASNMTAEELVEHFKDHPDIEVGLYEEEMIGAPYTGSYMTDSMAPYLSDSPEVIDSGTSINLIDEPFFNRECTKNDPRSLVSVDDPRISNPSSMNNPIDSSSPCCQQTTMCKFSG